MWYVYFTFVCIPDVLYYIYIYIYSANDTSTARRNTNTHVNIRVGAPPTRMQSTYNTSGSLLSAGGTSRRTPVLPCLIALRHRWQCIIPAHNYIHRCW